MTYGGMIKGAVAGFVIFWALIFVIATFTYLRWLPLSEYDPVIRGYLMFCSLICAFAGATNFSTGKKS